MLYHRGQQRACKVQTTQHRQSPSSFGECTYYIKHSRSQSTFWKRIYYIKTSLTLIHTDVNEMNASSNITTLINNRIWYLLFSILKCYKSRATRVANLIKYMLQLESPDSLNIGLQRSPHCTHNLNHFLYLTHQTTLTATF